MKLVDPQKVMILQLERFKPVLQTNDIFPEFDSFQPHFPALTDGKGVDSFETSYALDYVFDDDNSAFVLDQRGIENNMVSLKIEDPVTIPSDYKLDFTHVYDQKEGKLFYEIKSFICHEGPTGNSGHYTSYVKKQNGWYFCNDLSVQLVSEELIKEEMPRAYIFMLERCPN